MNNVKVGILIKKISLEFDKKAIPFLTPYELTPTQYKIIKYLYDHDNVIGMDIQNAFSMTNPTVTGIIQNLELLGWIERIPNPEDSRSKIIKLTDKTVSKKSEIYKLGDNLESEFTKGLTEKEKEDLVMLLLKIIDGIK